MHASCFRVHHAVLNSVHLGASGCMRSAPGSTSLYSIQYTRVLPGARRVLPGASRVLLGASRVLPGASRVLPGACAVLPCLQVLHPNVYGESTEAQGVSPSVHTVLGALQGLTPRLCVALSYGQTALRGQSAFHRPRSARRMYAACVVSTQCGLHPRSARCVRVARVARSWRALCARGVRCALCASQSIRENIFDSA